MNEHLIGGKFLVPMRGNTHLAAGHQCSHLVKNLIHGLDPPAVMF